MLRGLEHLRRLTSLSLRSYSDDFYGGGMPATALSGLTRLRALDLSESDFSHLDRYDWGLHTHCTALSLGRSHRWCRAPSQLSGLAPHLTVLRQLRFLDLRHNAIGDEGTAALGAQVAVAVGL